MYCRDDRSSSSVDARVGVDIRILNIPLSLSLRMEAIRFNTCHHCVCSSKYTHGMDRTSSISFISAQEDEKSVNSGLLEAEIRRFELLQLSGDLKK
jgi:hypothetical protein